MVLPLADEPMVMSLSSRLEQSSNVSRKFEERSNCAPRIVIALGESSTIKKLLVFLNKRTVWRRG